MMKYNSALDNLFEQWIDESERNGEWQSAGRIIFTKDGLLEKNEPADVETLWHNSHKRILFLIKDQPTEWSDDIRWWLKDRDDDNIEGLARKKNNRELRSRFLRNIANVFWGLYHINNPNDCEYSKAAESLEDVKRCFNTAPIALMESKKQGGKSSISNKTLKTYLDRYKDFLQKELDVLSPNIIVCTNNLIYDFVIGYYNEKYPGCPLHTLEGHQSIRIHPETKTLIFNSFHPSAHIGYEKFYMGVMDHYRAFLQSEDFYLFKSLYD